MYSGESRNLYCKEHALKSLNLCVTELVDGTYTCTKIVHHKPESAYLITNVASTSNKLNTYAVPHVVKCNLIMRGVYCSERFTPAPSINEVSIISLCT